MKNHRLSLLFPVFLSVTLVSSCGGGGGSGGTTASAPVAITSGNAETAAGASAATAQSTYEAGSMGGGLAIGANVRQGRPGFRIVPFAKSRLRFLTEKHFRGNSSSVASIMVKTDLPCDNAGGTASMTWNDADNSLGLTPGDSFSITFDDCLDSEDQETSSGSISMTLNSVSGNPRTDLVWSVNITLTMTNLTITDGAGTDTLNGDITLAMSSNDGGVNAAGAISGNSLTVTENGVTETLSDYTITFTNNDATSAYTIDSSGTVSSSELGGSVRFETLTTFEGIDPDYPHTGVMKITGASDSSITLAAIDSTTVRLDIDEDGDGVTDLTLTARWSELDA